eukprot:1846027-Amphidinium_carterae.2
MGKAISSDRRCEGQLNRSLHWPLGESCLLEGRCMLDEFGDVLLPRCNTAEFRAFCNKVVHGIATDGHGTWSNRARNIPSHTYECNLNTLKWLLQSPTWHCTRPSHHQP